MMSGEIKEIKPATRAENVKWINFYSSQNFGIWIECSKCQKWRKCVQYQEAHEVEETWCCSMNTLDGGAKSSCYDTEENTEELWLDYSPGSIVWAKLDGYPWWPAMVDVDPDTIEYYMVKQNGVIHYNVTFFDESVTHSWLSSKAVKPFLENPCKPKSGFELMSAAVWKAEQRAKIAVGMTVNDRLKKFSFVHQYKGKWPLKKDDPGCDTQDTTAILLDEENFREPFDSGIPDVYLTKVKKENDINQVAISKCVNQNKKNCTSFKKKELKEECDLTSGREFSNTKGKKDKLSLVESSDAFEGCKIMKISKKKIKSSTNGLNTKEKNFLANAEVNYNLVSNSDKSSNTKKNEEELSSNISPVRLGVANSSKKNNDGDKHSADELCLDYSPGSIVWAKLDGYAWWPAMVDKDPDTAEYYWVKQRGVIPEKTSDVLKAEKNAKIAVGMTLKDRLKKFSFVNQYKGKCPLEKDDPGYDTQDTTDILLDEENFGEPFDSDISDEDLTRLKKEKDLRKKSGTVSFASKDSVNSAKREGRNVANSSAANIKENKHKLSLMDLPDAFFEGCKKVKISKKKSKSSTNGLNKKEKKISAIKKGKKRSIGFLD